MNKEKEKEQEYFLALAKSVSVIQDCLFEIAKRLEELERKVNNET